MTTTKSPMIIIAGPCVIEGEQFSVDVAKEIKRQLEGLNVELYFKSSFDKANRTSIDGFRGPGLQEGMRILNKVKGETGLKLCTDFHTPDQAETVAQTVDFLQVPAFLCRQTDMIIAGAEATLRHEKKINIKKGQFLAPWDAKNIIEKAHAVQKKMNITRPENNKDWVYLTERGSSFGYNTLIVDMAGIPHLKSLGVPVIFDATHAIQMPGGGAGGKSTGGRREALWPLSRAAVAAGVDALFFECHPNPPQAKSDGANSLELEKVGTYVRELLKIRELVASFSK